jgi:hypothetical protein
MCAVHEAVHFLGQKMGASTYSASAQRQASSRCRVFENGRLISTILSSQQQLVDFMLKHQLSGRYVRFDALPSPEQTTDLRLDIATARLK